MAQRHLRLARSLTSITESVLDIQMCLADGYQLCDEPIIKAACYDIAGQLIEAEDVELDILAAKRALTVGRKFILDEHFKVRENSLRRRQEETPERWNRSEVSDRYGDAA